MGIKVCLVAQAENWQGGIQQYTQHYAEALAQRAEISILGYRSFFPTWLYPGDRETLTRQPGPSNGKVPVFNILKYYSLLSVFQAFQLIHKRLRPDVMDIQWCTTFHAPILIPLAFLVRRFSRTSVVLTVHNVLPHETRFFDKILCKILYTLADTLIVHSTKMKNDLVRIFHIPPERISIIPHGICLNSGKEMHPVKVRKVLGIKEERVILFFGLVRRYKGLESLLAAFSRIKDGSDVGLLLAGDFIEGKDRYQKIIHDYGMEDRVHIHSRYIPDDEVPLFFSASDFLVLPYVSFSGQSGVPPTAYHYSRPVIATSVGGLPEIVLHGKTGLVVEPGNVDQMADAISFFLKHPERMEAYGANGKRFLEQELSWEGITERMLDIYWSTLTPSPITPELQLQSKA